MIRSISNHINFTSAPQPAVDEQRKQKQEQVATGIGGAAGVTATATRYAGKKVCRRKPEKSCWVS